jgi:hypothetical protein
LRERESERGRERERETEKERRKSITRKSVTRKYHPFPKGKSMTHKNFVEILTNLEIS